MSEETATLEVPEGIKKIGNEIAEMTLKDAKTLSDYLKDEYGIEPAAAGAVAMVAAADGGAGVAAEEQTEFNLILTSFGEKKIGVIKEVRAMTGLGLKEAKERVESVPSNIKEGVSKEDAEEGKKKLEEAGASVEIK